LEKHAARGAVIGIGGRRSVNDAHRGGRIGLGISLVEPAGRIAPLGIQHRSDLGRAAQDGVLLGHEDVGAVLAAGVVALAI